MSLVVPYNPHTEAIVISSHVAQKASQKFSPNEGGTLVIRGRVTTYSSFRCTVQRAVFATNRKSKINPRNQEKTQNDELGEKKFRILISGNTISPPQATTIRLSANTGTTVQGGSKGGAKLQAICSEVESFSTLPKTSHLSETRNA